SDKCASVHLLDTLMESVLARLWFLGKLMIFILILSRLMIPLELLITTCFLISSSLHWIFFFFQAEDGIRDFHVTGVQTCALPISTILLHNHRWQFRIAHIV